MKYLMTIALTFALAACGGKKDKDEPKPTPPPAGSAMTGSAGSGSAAMTGSGSAGSAAPAAVDVPTEMDFEQQAKTDITDKNVDTEVKKIEADLGSGN